MGMENRFRRERMVGTLDALVQLDTLAQLDTQAQLDTLAQLGTLARWGSRKAHEEDRWQCRWGSE